MTVPLPDQLTGAERRAILDRDGWRCTEIVQPRVIRPGVVVPREPRRCPVMGSEMVVRNGQTVCPRHAESDETQRCPTCGETGPDVIDPAGDYGGGGELRCGDVWHEGQDAPREKEQR